MTQSSLPCDSENALGILRPESQSSEEEEEDTNSSPWDETLSSPSLQSSAEQISSQSSPEVKFTGTREVENDKGDVVVLWAVGG